ncbi:MAG TPA: hypothetical protein VK745_06370 [Polyangiaceae bacterium]|nr:hypothetical protein [Polyangiaceae bacterium]
MTARAVREPGSRVASLAACAACLIGSGCRPADANLGGTWNCSGGRPSECFYFDGALQTPSSDGGIQYTSNDAVRALFDVPEDPDPANAPRIAYPLDETTEPINLYDLDIQWHRLRLEQQIFRISVQSSKLPRGRYDIYTQCFPSHDGCHYSVPGIPAGGSPQDDIWLVNVLAPLTGSDADLTVAASDGKGGPISVSAPVHLHFSSGAVPGGLYYWSAHPPNAPPGSPDEGTTYRLALGARTAAPFIRPGKENPDQCEGCHAVSRDGTVIAFTATDNLVGPGSGSFIFKQTTNPTDALPPPGMNDSAMIALNNRGTLAIVGMDNTSVSPPQHGALYLRNLVQDVAPGLGAQIDPALLNNQGGYFPDFSPDEKHIVVTLSDHPDSPWAVRTGSIATLDFDKPSGTFSNATVLVPMTDQEFHFYPSWSPDNNWIVFVSAPVGSDPANCRLSGATPPTYDLTGAVCVENSLPACVCPPDSYDQPNSRLRLAHFPDGRVYDLDRATQGAGLTSTLPKFATQLMNTPNPNEFFITFNSKMPYGVEVPDNSPAQLWLSVLDIDHLPDDPSSAPVWLPFQSFGQKNHLAYWTETVPCRTDVDPTEECGPDETCIAHACTPIINVK